MTLTTDINAATLFSSQRALVHAVTHAEETVDGFAIISRLGALHSGFVAQVNTNTGAPAYLAHDFRDTYSAIVHEATGRTDRAELDAIEESMRQDVFASTLDWQTRPQLHKGADEALVICTVLGTVKPDFKVMRREDLAAIVEFDSAPADVLAGARAEYAERVGA